MTNIKNTILTFVQENKITMIPRWKFILYSTLTLSAIAFLFLVLIFVVSLIFFVLSRYGFIFMPMFGFLASFHAITAVPVALFACALLILVVIEAISRKYSFVFKKPLALTVVILTLLAIGIGFAVGMTPMHEYIRDYAREHNINILREAYKRPMPKFPSTKGVPLHGKLIATTSETYRLGIFEGEDVIVYASSTFIKQIEPKLGEHVLFFGTFAGEDFIATEIHKAPKAPFKERERRMNR
jgi:hypothetical protein